MTTVVQICNLALGEIGVNDSITSLTEGSTAANACNLVYAALRDEVLRAHEWGFATARAKLAKLAAGPTFGFDNAFALPSDWLRTVSVHGESEGLTSPRYRQEGGRVLSDSDDIYLRYVRRVTDPNAFDELFVSALVFRIAWAVARPIVNSQTVRDEARESFVAAMAKARGVDDQEDFDDAVPEGSWVGVRN